MLSQNNSLLVRRMCHWEPRSCMELQAIHLWLRHENLQRWFCWKGINTVKKTLKRNEGVYSKNKPCFKSAIVGPREVFVGAHRSGSTPS